MTADWYFDFISPFSYLQLARMAELPGLHLRPRPVLFAGLLAHWGQLGQAEIPAKRSFSYRHVTWMARQWGIPFRFPPAHPFRPLPALRLCVALGAPWTAVRAIFHFVWAEGRDPNEEWTAMCERLGLAPEAAQERIAESGVKAALRSNTDAAIAARVFGVPTVVLDGQIFWGVDALEMLVDYLRDPQAFEDAEMRRVGALPSAVQRGTR